MACLTVASTPLLLLKLLLLLLLVVLLQCQQLPSSSGGVMDSVAASEETHTAFVPSNSIYLPLLREFKETHTSTFAVLSHVLLQRSLLQRSHTDHMVLNMHSGFGADVRQLFQTIGLGDDGFDTGKNPDGTDRGVRHSTLMPNTRHGATLTPAALPCYTLYTLYTIHTPPYTHSPPSPPYTHSPTLYRVGCC